MKNLEELKYGDIFELDTKVFIVTQDFDARNNKKCISLENGETRWIESSSLVNPILVCKIDKDNNIIPIKKSNDTIL